MGNDPNHADLNGVIGIGVPSGVPHEMHQQLDEFQPVENHHDAVMVEVAVLTIRLNQISVGEPTWEID